MVRRASEEEVSVTGNGAAAFMICRSDMLTAVSVFGLPVSFFSRRDGRLIVGSGC